MITVKNLSKTFGEVAAVKDLSLSIPEGEIFVLLGPNGAGKTTTIKMLTGVYQPDEGSVEITEVDIQQEPEKAKSSIGYIPDDPIVYEQLTGREFLHFVGKLFLMSSERIDEKVEEYLTIYPIADLLDAPFESYSRGTKQKLAIIAAFLHEPKVLIVDEPILGLDPQSARATKDLFCTFKEQGGTVFICTHTLSFAEQVADRVGIMEKGKLTAVGTLDELKKKVDKKEGHLEEVFLRLTHE